jgi:hypothetical protein
VDCRHTDSVVGGRSLQLLQLLRIHDGGVVLGRRRRWEWSKTVKSQLQQCGQLRCLGISCLLMSLPYRLSTRRGRAQYRSARECHSLLILHQTVLLLGITMKRPFASVKSPSRNLGTVRCSALCLLAALLTSDIRSHLRSTQSELYLEQTHMGQLAIDL